MKTYGELCKWPNDDEFSIRSIEIASRYPGMQQITRAVSEDNDNVSVSFQAVCMEFNTSLIELYTFGFDAYRQVAEQLMQIKNTPWRIQLETIVDVDERVPRTIPLTSPPVHFDNKSDIVPHYVETFKRWEKVIVALVELHYHVLYLKINVYTA